MRNCSSQSNNALEIELFQQRVSLEVGSSPVKSSNETADPTDAWL